MQLGKMQVENLLERRYMRIYIVRQISGRSRSRFKPEESAICARREGSVSLAVSKNQGIISLSRPPPP